MYCEFCGKEISDNITYCSYCGKKLSVMESDIKTSRTEIVDCTSKDEIPKKKKPWWLLGVLAIALLVIGICGWKMIGERNNTIQFVKELPFAQYHDKTFGWAFDHFFHNPQWDFFKDEYGEYVVEFSGECTYEGEHTVLKMQFYSFDTTNKTSKKTVFIRNGETLSDEETRKIIDYIYEYGGYISDAVIIFDDEEINVIEENVVQDEKLELIEDNSEDVNGGSVDDQKPVVENEVPEIEESKIDVIEKIIDKEIDFRPYVMEFIYYDMFTDYSVKIHYTDENDGTFEMHLEETDEETDITSFLDYEGLFNQNISGQGNIDGILHVTYPEIDMEFGIYYVDDHYEMELWNPDGEYFTLYEKEWSSEHAG